MITKSRRIHEITRALARICVLYLISSVFYLWTKVGEALNTDDTDNIQIRGVMLLSETLIYLQHIADAVIYSYFFKPRNKNSPLLLEEEGGAALGHSLKHSSSRQSLLGASSRRSLNSIGSSRAQRIRTAI